MNHPKPQTAKELVEAFNKRAHRFWAKVDKASPNGCWIWRASKRGKGYGSFSFDRHTYIASRLIFIVTSGQDLKRDDLVIHSCDNPACVNPAHLSVGSYKTNRRDCVARHRAVHHGELNHAARLTAQQVKLILSRYRKNVYGYIRVARDFKVTPNTVRQIISGRKWKHIPR